MGASRALGSEEELMAVRIGEARLVCEDIHRVARRNEPVELSDGALQRIQHCRDFVERKVKERAVMYGVTTGIGELSETILTPEQTERFQRFLVYSHAAGYGEPLQIPDARSAVLSRIGVLSRGHSGIRPVLVKTMVEMLNRGVTPVMCEKGSVGACGDLSPMSQFALVLIGEGEAFFEGDRLPAKIAMERAGIPVHRFEARDGLAAINGSNCISGMGSLQVVDAVQWLKQAEIAAALTLEVLNANMLAYDERIHKIRGFPGAQETAANVRRITDGSVMLQQKGKKVQDAYSLRSTPQVSGAARDALRYTRSQIEIEINGVGDNPLFFPDDDGGTVLTGANFQGTPMALGLETLGTAVTTVCVLSERRLNRLLNRNLSVGLPAFLTKGAGMFSGMMLSQYTAGALCCESRILSHPAATGSIPAAADQEDFVSMGMTTALKTKQILKNAQAVLAIEIMAAAQAFDFRRPLRAGKGSEAAYEVVRRHVTFMEEDRPLYDDINRLAAVVESGEILEAVEKAVGPLA
jgi:histidine ammonia-lyase